eukprot:51384-Hanusia_phi.AAC.1
MEMETMMMMNFQNKGEKFDPWEHAFIKENTQRSCDCGVDNKISKVQDEIEVTPESSILFFRSPPSRLVWCLSEQEGKDQSSCAAPGRDCETFSSTKFSMSQHN